MTDELTTDLATISALRVVSRGSVMQYKGAHRPPTPEIAKLLNVDAVVEGSVTPRQPSEIVRDSMHRRGRRSQPVEPRAVQVLQWRRPRHSLRRRR
jgi:hypothetical protein